ncbi:LacI family DNA-binding transcriptional regulator [Brenneria tiliae]|uniref:LacI family DNA-binding transcriptional regulator n=1 Tax=Brenneria tiliae TaxID=2914984 RepID=UPI002014921A|nr:LacI family DNA-binding transcriptional regulator [Brenneria tiliae]MCL2899883.1 LacI family DNA-binding transcriptional regulator [Brenneria tiliae]MCL2904628.1 LacI family DNA-binding transcriptional regulator [Brenneria tiliae]
MNEPTRRKRSYATIRDVAARAKAGKTSISRYLGGEFHLLSDDLRQRIENAIRELEYRPNQMARSLKHGRTRLIGLIIADISNPFSVEVLRGVEAEANQHGFMTVVCNSRNSIELECEYLNLLNGYRVDGLIINSAGINDAFLQALKATTLPFVLIDRKVDDFPCDMVGLDNPQAAALATDHLINQGFEALLFLSEPARYISTRQERLQTFHQILQQHPHISAQSHEVQLPAPEEIERLIAGFCSGHRGMRKAVIAANGVLTLQVAQALNRLGLHWGTDIGFLSFDNLEWAALAGKGITSVSQPTAEMGRKAVTCLLNKLDNPEYPPAQHLFSGELIIRGSTSL